MDNHSSFPSHDPKTNSYCCNSNQIIINLSNEERLSICKSSSYSNVCLILYDDATSTGSRRICYLITSPKIVISNIKCFCLNELLSGSNARIYKCNCRSNSNSSSCSKSNNVYWIKVNLFILSVWVISFESTINCELSRNFIYEFTNSMRRTCSSLCLSDRDWETDLL